jgi:hypothetical protein
MSNSVNLGFLYEQPFSIGGHTKRTYLRMKGPSSYDSTNKDVIYATIFGGGPNTKILNAHVHRTISGTYTVIVQFSGEGPALTFKLIWFVVATGVEVANAVDLSAERFRLEADFIQ